jgi:hypothetical protein
MFVFLSNLKHFFISIFSVLNDFFWKLVEVLYFNTFTSLWLFNYKSSYSLYGYRFLSFFSVHIFLLFFRFFLFILYSVFCFFVFVVPSLAFVLLVLIFKIKVTNFDKVSGILELVFNYKLWYAKLPYFLESHFFSFVLFFFKYFFIFSHLLSSFFYCFFFFIVRLPFWLFFWLFTIFLHFFHFCFYYIFSLPFLRFFLPLYVFLVDFFSIVIKIPLFFYYHSFVKFFNFFIKFFKLPSFVLLYVNNFFSLFLPQGVIFFPLFGTFFVAQNLLIIELINFFGRFFFDPRILFTLFYAKPKTTAIFFIKVIKSFIYICGFLVAGSILSSILHMELLTTTLKLFVSCLIFLICTLEFKSFSVLLDYSYEYNDDGTKEVFGDNTLDMNYFRDRDWIQMYLLSFSDDDYHMDSDDTQRMPEFTGAFKAGTFYKPLENFYNLFESSSSYKIKRNFFGPLGKNNNNKRKFFSFYSETFSFFFLIDFFKEIFSLFIVFFLFQSSFIDRQVLLPLDRYPFEADAVEFQDKKSIFFLTQMTLDHQILSDVGMAYVSAPVLLADYLSLEKEQPSRMIWLYYAKLRHLVHGGPYLNQYVPPHAINSQARSDKLFSKLLKDKPFVLHDKTKFRSLAHRLNLHRAAADWFELGEDVPGEDLEEATEELHDIVNRSFDYQKFFYNSFFDKDLLDKNIAILSSLSKEDLADVSDADEFSEFLASRHSTFLEFDYDKYSLTNYGISKLKNQIGVPSSSEKSMLFLRRKLTTRDMSLLLKGRTKKVNLENISGTLRFNPRSPSKKAINPDFDRVEFSFYEDESFKTKNNFFSHRHDYKYPFPKVGQVFFGDVPEERWTINMPLEFHPPMKKQSRGDYDPTQLVNIPVEMRAVDPDWLWLMDGFDKKRFPSFYHRELDYQYNKKSKQVLKNFLFPGEDSARIDREPRFINSSFNFGFFREKLFQKYLTAQFESHYLRQQLSFKNEENPIYLNFGNSLLFKKKGFDPFFLNKLSRGALSFRSIARMVFFNRSRNNFGFGYSGTVNNLAFIPKSRRFVYTPLLQGSKYNVLAWVADIPEFRNALSILYLTRLSDFYRYNKEFFYLNTGQFYKNPLTSKDPDTRFNESYFFRIFRSPSVGFKFNLDLFSNKYSRTFFQDVIFHNSVLRPLSLAFTEVFSYGLSFLTTTTFKNLTRSSNLKMIDYVGFIASNNFLTDAKTLSSYKNVRFATKQLGGGRTLYRSFLAENGFLFNNSTSLWFSSKAPPKFKQAADIMDWDSYVSYLRFNLLLALNPVINKKPSLFSHYVLDPWIFALRPVRFFFSDVFNLIDSSSDIPLSLKFSVLQQSFRNNFVFFSSLYKLSFLEDYFFKGKYNSPKREILMDDDSIVSRPFMFTEDLYYRSRFLDIKLVQPFFQASAQHSFIVKPLLYQNSVPLEIANLLDSKKKSVASFFLDWSGFFLLDPDYFYNLASFTQRRSRFFSELFGSTYSSDYRSFFYMFFIKDEPKFLVKDEDAEVPFFPTPLSYYSYHSSSYQSSTPLVTPIEVDVLPNKNKLVLSSLPLFFEFFFKEKSFRKEFRRDFYYFLVGDKLERWFPIFIKSFLFDLPDLFFQSKDILPSILVPGSSSFQGSQSFYVYKDFLESVFGNSHYYSLFSKNIKTFNVDLLNLKNTSWFFWKTPLLRHSDIIFSASKVSILSSNSFIDRSKFYSNNKIVRFNIAPDFWSSCVESPLLDRLKLTNTSNSFFSIKRGSNVLLDLYYKVFSLKSSVSQEVEGFDLSTFSGPLSNSDSDDKMNFLDNRSSPLDKQTNAQFAKDFFQQKHVDVMGRSYYGFSWFFRNFAVWDMRSFWSFTPSNFYIGFKDQDSIDPVYFFSFDNAANKFHNIIRPNTMKYVIDRFPNYIRKQDYWLNDVPSYSDTFFYIGHYIDKLKTLKTFNVDTAPEMRKKSSFISLVSEFEKKFPEQMAKVIFGAVKPPQELRTSDYQHPRASFFTEKYRRLLPSYFNYNEAVPFSVLYNSTLRYSLPGQIRKIKHNTLSERFLYDDKTAVDVRFMLSKLALGFTDIQDENIRAVYAEDPVYFNTIRPLRFFHFFGRRLINPGSFFADKPMGQEEVVPSYHFNYDTDLPRSKFTRVAFHPQFYQMFTPLVHGPRYSFDFYNFPGPFLDQDFDLIASPYNENLEVISNRRLPFEETDNYNFQKMKKKYPLVNSENYMADCYAIAGKETRYQISIDGPPLQRSFFFYRPGGPNSLRFLDKVQMSHYFHRTPFYDAANQVFPVSPMGDTPSIAASYLYLTRIERSYDFPFIKPSLSGGHVPDINKLPFVVWAFLSEIFRHKSQSNQDKLLYMWDILIERRLRRAPRPIELYVNLPVGHYKRRFFSYAIEGFISDADDYTEMTQATSELDISQYPESGREELLAPMYDVFFYNNIFTVTWFSFFSKTVSLKTNNQSMLTDRYNTDTNFSRDSTTDSMELFLHTAYGFSAIAPGTSILHVLETFLLNYIVIFLSAAIDLFSTSVSPYTGRGIYYMVSGGFFTSLMIFTIALISVFIAFMWYFQIEEMDEPDDELEERLTYDFEDDDEALFEAYIPTGDELVTEFLEQIRLANVSTNTFPLSKSFLVNVLETQDLYGDVLTRYNLRKVVMKDILGEDREYAHVIYHDEFPDQEELDMSVLDQGQLVRGFSSYRFPPLSLFQFRYLRESQERLIANLEHLDAHSLHPHNLGFWSILISAARKKKQGAYTSKDFGYGISVGREKALDTFVNSGGHFFPFNRLRRFFINPKNQFYTRHWSFRMSRPLEGHIKTIADRILTSYARPWFSSNYSNISWIFDNSSFDPHYDFAFQDNEPSWHSLYDKSFLPVNEFYTFFDRFFVSLIINYQLLLRFPLVQWNVFIIDGLGAIWHIFSFFHRFFFLHIDLFGFGHNKEVFRFFFLRFFNGYSFKSFKSFLNFDLVGTYKKRNRLDFFYSKTFFPFRDPDKACSYFNHILLDDDESFNSVIAREEEENVPLGVSQADLDRYSVSPYINLSDNFFSRQKRYDPILTLYFNANYDTWADTSYIRKSLIIYDYSKLAYSKLNFKHYPELDPRPESYRILRSAARHYFYKTLCFRKLLNSRANKTILHKVLKNPKDPKVMHKFKYIVQSKPEPAVPAVFKGFPGSFVQDQEQPPIHYTNLFYFLLFNKGNTANTSVFDLKRVKYNNPFAFVEGYTFSNFFYFDEFYTKPKSDLFALSRPFVLLRTHEFLFNFYFGSQHLRLEFLKKFLMIEFRYRDRLKRSVNNLNFSNSVLLNDNFNSDFTKNVNKSTALFFKHFFYGTVRQNSSLFYPNNDPSFFPSSWFGLFWHKFLSKFYFNYRNYGRSFVNYSRMRNVPFVYGSSLFPGKELRRPYNPLFFSIVSDSRSQEVFDNHFFADEVSNLHYSSFLFPLERSQFLATVNSNLSHNNRTFWDFYLFHSNAKLLNVNSSSFKKPIETSYFTVYPLFNVFGLPLDLSSLNYNYDFFFPELFCNNLFDEHNNSVFKQLMMLDFIDHVSVLRYEIVDSLDIKNFNKLSQKSYKKFPCISSKLNSNSRSSTLLKKNFPFEKFENYKLFLYFILHQDFSYTNFVNLLDSFSISSFFYNPDSVLFQLTKPIHSNDIYNYSLLFAKEESSLERLFALKQRLYYEGSEQFLKSNNINNMFTDEFFSDDNKMDSFGQQEHSVDFENDLFFHFGNLDFDLDNNSSVYFGGNPHVWFYYKFLLDNMPTRFRLRDAKNFDAFVSKSKLFDFSFASYDSNWFLDLLNYDLFSEASFDNDFNDNFIARFDSDIREAWGAYLYTLEDTSYNEYVRKLWFYKKKKKLWAGLKKHHLRTPNVIIEDFNLSNPITVDSFKKYGNGLDFFNTSFSRDVSKKIALSWNKKLLVKLPHIFSIKDLDKAKRRGDRLKGKGKSKSDYVFRRKKGLRLKGAMGKIPHTNESWFMQSLYNRHLIDGFESNKGNFGYGTLYGWAKSSNYFYNLSHFSLEGRSSHFSVVNNTFTQRPSSSVFYAIQPLDNSLNFLPALKYKKPKFQIRHFLKKYRSSLGFSRCVLSGLSLLPFSLYLPNASSSISFDVVFHRTNSFTRFINREILSFVKSISEGSVQEQKQPILLGHNQLYHGSTVLRTSSSNTFVNPIFEESNEWFAADSNSLFFVDLWVEQDYHEFLVHLHLDSSLKKNRQLDFFSLEFERLFFKRKFANITFENYLYSNNVFDRMDLDFDYFVQYFFVNGVFPEFLEMRFINFLLYSFSKDMQFLMNLVYAGFDLTSFSGMYDYSEGFSVSDRPSNLVHSSELAFLPKIPFTTSFNNHNGSFDFRVPFSVCFPHLSPLVSNLFNPLPGDWVGNYDFLPFFLTDSYESWSLDANRVSNFMLNFSSNNNIVNSWGLLSSFENLERVDLGDISPKYSTVFRQNFFSNFTTRLPSSSFDYDSELLFSGAGEVDTVVYENLVYNFFGSDAVKSIRNFKSKNMRSGQQALDWYRLRQESSFVALSDEALCFHILRLHFLNFKFFFHNDLSLDPFFFRLNFFSSYFPASKTTMHYLFNDRLFFSSFYDMFKFNLSLIMDCVNLDLLYSIYWSFLNERFAFFFQLFYFSITPSLFLKNMNFLFYSNFINMPIFHNFKRFVSLVDLKEFGFYLPFFLLVSQHQKYIFIIDIIAFFFYLFYFCFSVFLFVRIPSFWLFFLLESFI